MSAHVSIVIVNWNSAREVMECIANIRLTHDQPKIQIIVVDNDSTEPVRDIQTCLGRGDTLVRMTENSGFGAACNEGASHATGRLLLFLNPDARIETGSIQHMVKALEDRTIGIVGIRHVNPDGSLQWSTDDAPNLVRELLYLTPLHKIWPFTNLVKAARRWSDHSTDADVDWVNGACFMVDKETWRAIDGFDERFFLFAEELDLCARVWQSGKRVRFLARPTVIHKLGGSFSQGNARHLRLALLNQGMLRYFEKHRSHVEYIMFEIGLRAMAVVGLLGAAGAAAVQRFRPSAVDAVTWQALSQGEVGITGTECAAAWLRVLILRRTQSLRPTMKSSR